MQKRKFTKRAKRKMIFNRVIMITVVLTLILIYPFIVAVQITSKQYSFFNVYKIVAQGLKEKVLNNDYSETLNTAMKDRNFDKTRVDQYLTVDYFNKENFIKRINTLLDLGYTVDEINLINKKIPDEIVDALQKKAKVEDILKYLEFDFFKGKNFDRYLNYHKGDYKNTLVKVNLGLDKPPYSDVKTLKEFNVTMLLYNKYIKLAENFVPPDLVKIKDEYSLAGEQFLHKEVAVAFEKLCDEAKAEGKYLLSRDAYRSYQDQADTYKRFLSSYGQEYADKHVARPGYSEHNAGLAIDFAAKCSDRFSTTFECKWLLENAHKYGFIKRYESESWHYRYVGVNVATYIHENNISFEEYYLTFLDK